MIKKLLLNKYVLCIIMLLLMVGVAGAATYYVDNGGQGDCADYRVVERDCGSGGEQVYDTVAEGVTALASGDTLNIREGTYTETEPIINPPSGGGTWATATTIQAYNGETVTLAPASGDRVVNIYTEAGLSWIIINDLLLDATATTYGVAFNARGGSGTETHHIRVTYCEATSDPGNPTDEGPFGFLASFNTNNIEFISCVSHDTGNHGFYIAGSDSLVEYCVAYNSGKAGIQHYSSHATDTNENVTLRYNLIYSNGTVGIHVNKTSGHKVYGNVSFNNTGPGIRITSATGTFVYNNTTYNNSTYGLVAWTATNTVFTNNIAWENGTEFRDYNSSGTTEITNSWDVFPGEDPLFWWENIAGSGWAGFGLQSLSPAIDAGTVVADGGYGIEYTSMWPSTVTTIDQDTEGASWEIGAYTFDTPATILAGFSPIYFVSNSGTDRIENGMDTDNPWKTIAYAQANCGTSNVYFKKGDTWREQLTVPASGTADLPIGYGAYGTGDDPIISGADDISTAGWADQGGDVWRHAIGAIEPNKVYFDNVVGTVDATPDAQYEWTYSNPNLDIYSTSDPDSQVYYTLIEATQRNDCVDMNGKNYITISGLSLRNAINRGIIASTVITDLTVDSCSFANFYWYAISIQDVTSANNDNIVISNNSFRETRAGFVRILGEDIANYNTSTITGNTFTMDGEGYTCKDANGSARPYAISLLSCHDSIVSGNTVNYLNFIDNAGVFDNTNMSSILVDASDNISISGNTLTGGRHGIEVTNGIGVDILRNRTIKTRDDGIWVGAGNTGTVNVVYNIVSDTGDDGISIDSSTFLYNNVISRVSDTGLTLFNGNSTIVKNNIIMDWGEATDDVGEGKKAVVKTLTATIDNNTWYRSSGVTVDWADSPDSLDFAGWQSAGYDNNGIYADPQFISTTDFRLQSGSPCIDAGVGVGLILDYAGETVPSGLYPDIGAYEAYNPNSITFPPTGRTGTRDPISNRGSYLSNDFDDAGQRINQTRPNSGSFETPFHVYE